MCVTTRNTRVGQAQHDALPKTGVLHVLAHLHVLSLQHGPGMSRNKVTAQQSSQPLCLDVVATSFEVPPTKLNAHTCEGSLADNPLQGQDSLLVAVVIAVDRRQHGGGLQTNDNEVVSRSGVYTKCASFDTRSSA